MTSVSQKQLTLALSAFLVAFFLWQYEPIGFLVFPLRMLVTFVHESGHGLAAIFTGGDFLHFELKSTGGGVAYSHGGIRSIIIPAGYVGTVLFGSVLLYLTNTLKRPEWLAITLGTIFSLLAIFYTGISLGNLGGFEKTVTIGLMLIGGGYFLIAPEDRGRLIGIGIALIGLLGLLYWGAADNALTIIVGVLSGIFLIGIGYLGFIGHKTTTIFTLNFLAFSIGLNAITDAWFLLKIVRRDDVLIRNDAVSMANEVGLSATFWALSWIVIAAITLGYTVWLCFFRKASNALPETTVNLPENQALRYSSSKQV